MGREFAGKLALVNVFSIIGMYMQKSLSRIGKILTVGKEIRKIQHFCEREIEKTRSRKGGRVKKCVQHIAFLATCEYIPYFSIRE